MKKIIIKSTIFSVIFMSLFVLASILVKAWNVSDPTDLQATTWDKATVLKWNGLYARTKPIVCYKNAASGWATSAWAWFYTFVAADCWGTLPDSTYVWMTSYISIPWASFTMFQVMNAGESWETTGTGPWVFARTSGVPWGSFKVRAVFIKK